MAKPLDMELKKAFTELQVKMIETKKKIQLIDTQIGVFKRCLAHSDLTKNEISKLPPGTKTYVSIGTMFLLKDTEEIKKNLKNRETQLTARVDDFQKNKQYLEKNLKESEDNIREMVQQRKQLEAKST